ncbi:hypothetical protein ACIA8F_06030 [Streptomyces sp. NPDC051563]|uniref:hypothetical protein n=1 Tax=Streptomyces sp. NPDC051563 TaxID=3365659 RepID=UPI0037A981E4
MTGRVRPAPPASRTSGSGVTTGRVRTAAARTAPSPPAADSIARSAVVPAAITYPPALLVAFTSASRAVAAGISYRAE